MNNIWDPVFDGPTTIFFILGAYLIGVFVGWAISTQIITENRE